MGNLWQDFMGHNDEIVDKWRHYFPAYERHFSPWVDRETLMLEIGVSQGGSLKMWQRYLGPFATIVGIDIDPACARLEAPGIRVRIGDQSDHGFLGRLVEEFGVPDLVLDDGSHHMDHVLSTFEFLYPQMASDSVYAVEDLHTGYLEEYGGGTDSPRNFLRYAHNAVMDMNRHWSREPIEADPRFDNTRSVSFYDSLVILEKGRPSVLKATQVGRRKMTARLRSGHFI